MIQGCWVFGDQNIGDALAVRHAVFVAEQGFSPDTEADATDAMSWHAILYEDDWPVATGRIYWQDGEFRLGRICVLKEKRGTGCGDLLMRLLLYKALDHNARSIALSAQTRVAPFYARYGFAPVGEVYDDEGVPHQLMRATPEQLKLGSPCQQGGGCPGNCAGCEKATQ